MRTAFATSTARLENECFATPVGNIRGTSKNLKVCGNIPLSLSCPEAARILLGRREKVTFQTAEVPSPEETFMMILTICFSLPLKIPGNTFLRCCRTGRFPCGFVCGKYWLQPVISSAVQTGTSFSNGKRSGSAIKPLHMAKPLLPRCRSI